MKHENSVQQETFTLEEAFQRLDKIIEMLECSEISLEDSFSGYQEGMELVKACSEKIDAVEKKMLVLNEKGETYEF